MTEVSAPNDLRYFRCYFIPLSCLCCSFFRHFFGRKKSDDTLAMVREDAERRRLRAQRRTGLDEFLADAEAEATKEAKKVTKDYEKRVQEIKDISDEKLKEAVDVVLKEVLPE